MVKPELLAPAGDYEKLMAAVLYGADAVYLGGEAFSLRTACGNFDDDALQRGIDFAKAHGCKAYIAANAVMKNGQLEALADFAARLQAYGADAVIVSDLGAFDVVRRAAPKLDVHVSTQANTTNYAAANVWHQLGASRVVLAREMSYPEVKELRRRTDPALELEVFVHGAMCMAYSGRCLLSSFMAGRDANSGACAQPCRWNYTLMEEQRPGAYFPVVEDEHGTYIFNSKDLCLIEFIPELVDAGVSSLKIEGRVKSEYYVANTVRVYRQEIDRYFENPDTYVFDPSQLEELRKVSHRVYSHGFWHGRDNGSQIYESSAYIRNYEVVGIVQSCDEEGHAVIMQKNKFSVGDRLEVLQPAGAAFEFVPEEMQNEQGEAIVSAAHGKMLVHVKLPQKTAPYSMVRKAVSV